ncbi:GMC family oxidoreductase [Myxococcota bacterium]|nr:GMC family oxidoreductase [Myxococcota bacterium]
MSRDSTVAIVGSGIVGSTLAFLLTARGHQVTIFEKGPEFPYPHAPQFIEKIQYLHHDNPKWVLPRDLKHVTLSGDYSKLHLDLDGERGMVVGGSATHWGGTTIRMRSADFRTKSKYGFGADWPISYEELEPYYCAAEEHLGISGTDADNPFAPPRSRPFPLPPFELTWDDAIIAERLRSAGVVLHTTPQARVRRAHDGRPGCMNMGVCHTCPIGARYSPTHHLERAIATGRCTLRPNTSIRRILVDASGRARGLVVRPHDADRDEEHAAKVVVVAGGALESTRLLLLSEDRAHPDGLGNQGGQLGRNLVFHHYYSGTLRYREKLWPGRAGPQTAQTLQFVDPATRGRHGGIKIDFHSWPTGPSPWERTSGAEILRDLEDMAHVHPIGIHGESTASDRKWVVLSEERDRFGDRFAHLNYDLSDFDLETHTFGRALWSKLRDGSGAVDGNYPEDPIEFSSGAHHMGTCRMGDEPRTSVLDARCRVHGSDNLFVVGGAAFTTASGGVHPTLTMTALAIRAADDVSRLLT